MSKKKVEAPNSQMVAIQSSCIELAGQKSKVQTLLAKIQNEQHAVTRKYADELQAEVSMLAMIKGRVLGFVTSARELFIKPKSRSFDGVAVGFEKERDSVTLPDDLTLIANIRKLLPPEKAKLLIHTPAESVRKDAIKDLTPQEKQLIGISTTIGADNAFVRLEKSDVENQAAALLAAFEPSASARPQQEGQKVAA